MKSKNRIILDASIEKRLSPKKSSISIETLLSKSVDSYDVTPRYQRDYVWKLLRQQKLIDSIVSGRDINSIHICRKQDSIRTFCTKYWCVDGKQRLETIRRFFKSEFYIYVRLDNEEIQKAKYSQIEEYAKKGDQSCTAICSRFLEYNLSLNIYEDLSEEEQKVLFQFINEAESLNANEKMFCTNLRAKGFYKTVYGSIIRPSLNEFLGINLKKNNRDKGSRLAVEFLLMSFGKDFDDPFAYRNLTPSDIIKTVEYQEELLKSRYGYTGEKTCDASQLERIIGEKQINQLRDCVTSFAYIFHDKKIVLEGKLDDKDKGWLTDCLYWIMKGIQSNVLTKAYMQENWQKFFEILKEFQRWRDDEKNKDLKLCGATGSRMEARIKQLDSLFHDPKYGFDTGIKNKKVPAKAVLQSILDAPTRDPISGRILTADNIDIDHVSPKSLSSETSFAAIDSHSNRKKGNIDKDFAEKLLAYQKDQEEKQYNEFKM